MARQMARLAQQDAVQARVAEQRRREALRQAEFREELEREGKVAKDAPIPAELAKLKGVKKGTKEGDEGEEVVEGKGDEPETERRTEAPDAGPKVRREIIINAARTSMPRVAILEDGRLAEMLLEQEKQVSVGDVLLAQVTAKVRAMAGLFVDVTVYKKAFLQAYNHHRPYVFRRLPNGSVEAVGGGDEDFGDGTDSGVGAEFGDGVEELETGSGSGKEAERNGTGRKEAEAGASDEEEEGGDDGEDDVMTEEGDEEEELQLGEEGGEDGDEDEKGESGDAEGKEGGGKDGHVALRQSGWTTSRNWQDVEVGDFVVVKCTKESYGSKGPKVSAVLSHPGRFVVLTARSDGVHISAKIRSGDERKRLETLGKLLKPAGYRLLLRTESKAAQGKEIQQDIYQVQTVIEGILRKAEEAVKRNTGALLLYKAMTPTQAIVRDLMSTEVVRLVVDTPEVHAQVMSYLAENNSEHLMNRVELYSGKQGVMDAFGVEGQINSIFQSRVQLESGAYLVIQKTEALWSIDVNGGRAVTSGNRTRAEAQSETHLRINLEAARQVAKELRARDVSGIVVIDFIDMASPAMNVQVEKAMWEALQTDRARVKMGKINEPGNCMQILRSRLRDNLANLLTAPCPLCTQDFHSVSAGRIPSREAVVAEIERTIVRKEADGSIPRTPGSAERPESNGRNPTWPTIFLTVHERVEQFFLGANLKRLNTTMAALRVNINVMVPDSPIREYDFQIQLSGRSEPLFDSAKDRKDSADRSSSEKAWGGGRKLAHNPEAHVIDVSPEEDDVSTTRRGAASKRRGAGEAEGAEEGGARRGYVYRKRDDVSERRKDDVSERRAEDVGERRRADVSERRRESAAETRREKGSERRLGDVSERRRDDVSERKREDISVQKKDTVSVNKKDKSTERKKDAVSERPTVRVSFTDGGGFESGEEDRKERRRKPAERGRKEPDSEKPAERPAVNTPQISPLAELLVSQESQPTIWSKVRPTKGPVRTQVDAAKQKESENGARTGPQKTVAENEVRGEVGGEALSGTGETVIEVQMANSRGKDAKRQGPSKTTSDMGVPNEAVSSAQNGALLEKLDTAPRADAGAVAPDDIIEEGSDADEFWGADVSRVAGEEAAESMTSAPETPEESSTEGSPNGADVSNGARADVISDADVSDGEGSGAKERAAGARRIRRGKKARAQGEKQLPEDVRRAEPEAGTPERTEPDVGVRAGSDLDLMMESVQVFQKVTKLSPDKIAKVGSVGSQIMTVLAENDVTGAGEPWNFLQWYSGERSGIPPERAERYAEVVPLLQGVVDQSVDDEDWSELHTELFESPDGNENGDLFGDGPPTIPAELLPMLGLADWSGALDLVLDSTVGKGVRDGESGNVAQGVYDVSGENGRDDRAERTSLGAEGSDGLSDDDVAPPAAQTSNVMTRPVVRAVPARPGPKVGAGNPSARPKRKGRQKKK
ncbi:only C-terminal homology ribonuclease E [Klebsormidium nitens]|uniref:Only C-terminal homology ribonuclease E n=1 Tax=Klebsormidium nitens TaxID=105231 RepID=A0A1Y1IJ81_KLENI|nr:only C-terminal homology ribonuclease E [Klebsormidium nitens]|eukprot:GAQ90935.1 only C-terminal homology ribonuclease E [Klebsormidium nitens]